MLLYFPLRSGFCSGLPASSVEMMSLLAGSVSAETASF
jgi:hypothetical protein